MEHQLWKAIVALLAEFGKPRFDPREDFTDHDIVRVWYWAAIHDRPTSWALCRDHWPPHRRRGLRLPSGGTMSKRLRRPTGVALLAQREERGSRRRYGSGHGHGHRRQTAGRLRSKELLENPMPAFGDRLRQDRAQIERYCGGLVSWGGGLTGLPAWVRTHRRVYRWVQAKLV